MGKISVYASNAYAVNTLDQDAAARNGQARSLMAKFGAATAFFDPELMQIGFSKLRQWMKRRAQAGLLRPLRGQAGKAPGTCALG